MKGNWGVKCPPCEFRLLYNSIPYLDISGADRVRFEKGKNKLHEHKKEKKHKHRKNKHKQKQTQKHKHTKRYDHTHVKYLKNASLENTTCTYIHNYIYVYPPDPLWVTRL